MWAFVPLVYNSTETVWEWEHFIDYPIEKSDSGPLGLLLTSPMKPLNRIQRSLKESKFSASSTKFVFLGADPKNNMAALASDWLRHILTFPLKPLNGIQRNLTGSKILTSSTKFVFFGPKSEKNCHPGQSIKEGGTLYWGARYGALWASCLWIYLGEVTGVHQFMYMSGNT